MDKTYRPRRLEERWYGTWEERGYFAPRGGGAPYSIVIPPPNVTGRLHMGHGFQHAVMDALIRYHRMLGRASLWQVGTDHAGIATQMVVERRLNLAGKSRREIGREAFVEKVWDWKRESGGVITQQLRRMGSSLDWSRERFTMDEGLSEAVEKVFVDLYDEGLIYRGDRLVNWDPALRTAVSDLEVVSKEESGSLWHFRYPVAGGGRVVIATTRPETLLGDTAVAVHPDDERHRALVGKFVELPLCGRRIPVIADEHVDRAFGTGCVKITPAHDFNDYEMGRRHGLDVINIFTEDARVNDAAPPAYRGLDRFEAREKVVADLAALGLVEKIEPHALKVPRGDRSGAVIEPYLTRQWYVAAKPLAGPAIEAVENGDIEFTPRGWENTYFNWMRGIQDWCISRQLWWGHRIPAWYDEDGNVFVGRGEADAREKHNLPADAPLRRDPDVLDTWFSSALWTFSTLGWLDDRETFERFHPTSVLVTGFDIIFFWVARMIMMTLKFTGQVPFKRVFITGLVRDERGQKMSKSKGNILDPIDLIDGISLDALIEKRVAEAMRPGQRDEIEKLTRASFPNGIAAHGTDALRFTFYSLASTGRDIKFDPGRIEGFRNFCNKIWNAARFVLMRCGDGTPAGEGGERRRSVADRWIASRFERAAGQVAEAMAGYRFDLASQALHEFVWDEFCDWYLELVKPALLDEAADPLRAAAARETLVSVLEKTMRLLHPFMPFITEEIWQRVAPLAGVEGETIMLQPFPEPDEGGIDAEAEEQVDWIKGVVAAVRNIRGEMGVPPAKAIGALLRAGADADRKNLERHRTHLRRLAGLDSVEWLEGEAPAAAAALHGPLEILVPLAGLIDAGAERARLDREIARLEGGLKAAAGKLGNAGFVGKAPEAVVAREREKERKLSAALSALREKRERLAGL